MALAIALLIAFELKKFFCSYVWQTPYMLRRVRGENWIGPSVVYALIHAAATFSIVTVFQIHETGFGFLHGSFQEALAMAGIDFAFQLVIDRVFLSVRFLGSFQPSKLDDFYADGQNATLNWKFWQLIGAKGLFHHLSTYLIIYLLMR